MTAIHVAALFGQTEVVQEFMCRAPKSVLLVSEVREAFVFLSFPYTLGQILRKMSRRNTHCIHVQMSLTKYTLPPPPRVGP